MDVMLFDPAGVGTPASGRDASALPEDAADGAGRQRAIAELLDRAQQHLCTSGEVRREMERLGFIDRRGSPPGFMITLPRGTAFERAVEALNNAHVAALNAVRIEFPLVFDGSLPAMQSLTEPYERQGRVFHLGNGDPALRLAYAADPALFSWLRGRDLHPGKLPYAVYSPAPAFRLWRSGELGLRAFRQYTLPDLHVLCLREQARDVFLALVTEAAKVTRRLFGEAFAQFIEHTDDFGRYEPNLAQDVATAGAQFTVVRPRRERLSTSLSKAASTSTSVRAPSCCSTCNGMT